MIVHSTDNLGSTSYIENGSQSRILFARSLSLVIPWIGFILQCRLATGWPDIGCSLIASLGATFVNFQYFRRDRLYNYPLSTLVVIGFSVTLLQGPLLFTALEGNPITYNLKVPIYTFAHAFAAVIVSIASHSVYRSSKFFTAYRKRLSNTLIRIKLFKPLTIFEVIVMGLIGTLSLGAASWIPSLQGTFVLKIIQGFQFFGTIPFAYLLSGLWGNEIPPSVATPRFSKILCFLFFILIVIISLGRNTRGTFVIPIVSLLLGLFFQWFYGLIKIRLWQMLSFSAAILFVLPLITDVSTAIVMLRGSASRSYTAPALVGETIKLLQHRDDIQKFRDSMFDFNLNRAWSESYVNNVFLARFSNAKFPDNSLVSALALTQSDQTEIANFQMLRLLSFFPQPILDLFSISPEVKKSVQQNSIGDELFFLENRSKYVLGGFRTSHFIGSGVAGFGYFYLAILFFVLIPIYMLVDAQALGVMHRSPIISAFAITQLTAWFTLSNNESVVSFVGFVIRLYWEPLFLFISARWALKHMQISI